MKIVHLCLSCFYIDGYAYQENELVAQNVRDGHEVTVIASTESFDEDRQVTYLQPSVYMGIDGATVIRLPYRSGAPAFAKRKLRMHPGLYDLLVKAAPDVILFHGLSGWEILTAVKYKKKHPSTRLFLDSHEDFNNSARNFLSKHVLHALYYKPIIKFSLPYIEKILCISIDTMNFAEDFYDIPASSLEFYPLGGQVFADQDYEKTRLKTRKCYSLNDNSIVFVQSGKMDRKKKLVEALTSFNRLKDSHAIYLLVGHIHPDILPAVNLLISADCRIKYVGWKSPDELRSLLCAADVYVQPGSQSATMQMSICCRCAVILDNVPSHAPFVKGNGWLIDKDVSLNNVFDEIEKDHSVLSAMSTCSSQLASKLLDYRSLAARLY